LLVIFGPVLETLLFQVGIISLVKRILPKLPIVSVIVSAFLFGLSHFYSGIYIYYTFIIGLFLATLYFIASKRGFNPFLVVFSVHAINNFLLFIAFEFVL
jgi:membrane protease YdiL (CAAX protease family)